MARTSTLQIVRSLILILSIGGLLQGHPMGNFSVNHYARFDFGRQNIELTYVLDLAEIPTLELLEQWRIPAVTGPSLQEAVERQAGEWVKQLQVTENGTPMPVRLKGVVAHIMDGAGGLQILRVDIAAEVPSFPGTLDYQDRNYAGRTGWKEIVIKAENSVDISQSSQGSADRSHALQIYPPNEIAAPPQDVRSAVTWSLLVSAKPRVESMKSLLAAHSRPLAPPAVVTSPTRVVDAPLNTVAAPIQSFTQQQPQPMGTMVRGDYLSRMLRNREIPFRLAIIGASFAFCLGAMHAFSPGHGKTIVAAYLVGTRGTLKHALFLGSMVTFTHTISVFALGLGVLFFQQYVVPDQIIPILGALSGLSIVAIGIVLMCQRAKALADEDQAIHGYHSHSHGHTHRHTHENAHTPTYSHESHDHERAFAHERNNIFNPRHSHAQVGHARDHRSFPNATSSAQDHTHSQDLAHVHQHPSDHSRLHVHSHGGRPHSHLPEGNITLHSLIALGVSGGLVPCPSALVLLLSAIALGRTSLGLFLLLSFSTGLALVLMAIGAVVIYAKRLLPAEHGLRTHPAFRYMPVFSAVVVIVLGLMMTGISMGWITPRLAI